MNTGGLLDQLLKAGSGMLGGQSGSSPQASQNSSGGNFYSFGPGQTILIRDPQILPKNHM